MLSGEITTKFPYQVCKKYVKNPFAKGYSYLKNLNMSDEEIDVFAEEIIDSIIMKTDY